MVKRALAVFVLLIMFSSSDANAGTGLFGHIPFLSGGSCGEGCAVDGICGETCTDPGDGCCDLLSDSCGESCGAGCTDLFGGLGSIGSCIKPSDHCFDSFISPITNPVFFEDPRTLTEARLIFAHHTLPNSLGAGSAQLYAMQIRAAISENVSIIATKDGFLVTDNPLLRDGWADIAAGLKVNLYRDVASQTLFSVGATYEAPWGSRKALQGNGDGEFHIFGTGGTTIMDDYHLLSGLGFRLPVDRAAESTSMYWSNHIDRRIGNGPFYLLGECNWYHWLSSGSAFPLAVEGVDIINLGSQGVAGHDIVTAAIGVKYKPSGNTEVGVAWEAPLTDRRDIFDDRLTVDWIIRY
ncbi:MAG: hypothetical protein R3C20_21370 [Planctomycetaceae bacterium]